MTVANSEISPIARLAIAYARVDLRPAFALLLGFDNRLSEIVGRASEPMIAQMKIAWWNDAIASEPSARPKGEPVFQALSELTVPGVDAATQQLLDAWGLLLSVDDWTTEVLDSFAETRSLAIFGSFAAWVGSDDDVSTVGKAWALADLRQRFGTRMVGGQTPASYMRTTRILRPLSILAFSVTEPSGVRMIWHALTGR